MMENGLLKLVDFNISRTYKCGNEKDTRAFGTKYYAAPEQYGYGQTDIRTDIYAVGKLMIELLAGGKQRLDGSLIDCGYLKPIILKCCAIDPANRFQNTTELLSVLQITLFDGFTKMRDDEVALIVALLETMTMENVAVNQLQKTGKGIVQFANGIIGFLNNNNVNIGKLNEPDVKEIWHMVDEKYKEIQFLSRNELDNKLYKLLSSKVGLAEDAPLDTVSDISYKSSCRTF